jgi:hypothetical protein
VDAGASLTYPQQAGTIRKNAFMVINNRPCKVRQDGMLSSQRALPEVTQRTAAAMCQQ